eukprot:751697-Hanusia_phi.AAC.2
MFQSLVSSFLAAFLTDRVRCGRVAGDSHLNKLFSGFPLARRETCLPELAVPDVHWRTGISTIEKDVN